MNMKLFVGNRVRLTAFHPEDTMLVSRWYEDGEFARLFDSSAAYPRSPSRLAKWLSPDAPGTDNYPFAIRALYSEDIIGVCDVDSIMWNHRAGWVSIGIGDPQNRGLGYGTEAMRLLMRFAFMELNLHRLQLTVFAYNTPAIRLYQKLGWTHEGTHREYLLRDGHRYDMLMYGMLAREFVSQERAGE